MMNPAHPPDAVPQADIDAAIRQATNEVFSTMLGIADVSAETLVQAPHTAGPTSGIFSLIGVAGAWAGTTSLVCSADFACKISSHFLQTPLEVVDDKVLDAIAELTNMIGGSIKSMLEQTFGEMSLSIPAVISGHDIQVHSARVNQWIIVRFSCADGELYVQTCLAPSQNPGQARAQPGTQLPVLLSR